MKLDRRVAYESLDDTSKGLLIKLNEELVEQVRGHRLDLVGLGEMCREVADGIDRLHGKCPDCEAKNARKLRAQSSTTS